MKKLTGLFFRGLAKLMLVLPRRCQFMVGDMLGLIWFDVLRVRRQIVLDNLRIAFPEMSLKDRTVLGRRAMRNMCRAIVDFSYFHVIHKEKYRSFFEIKGLEHLENARAKGKGICVLSMHLGNGDMGLAGLAFWTVFFS